MMHVPEELSCIPTAAPVPMPMPYAAGAHDRPSTIAAAWSSMHQGAGMERACKHGGTASAVAMGCADGMDAEWVQNPGAPFASTAMMGSTATCSSVYSPYQHSVIGCASTIMPEVEQQIQPTQSTAEEPDADAATSPDTNREPHGYLHACLDLNAGEWLSLPGQVGQGQSQDLSDWCVEHAHASCGEYGSQSMHHEQQGVPLLQHSMPEALLQHWHHPSQSHVPATGQQGVLQRAVGVQEAGPKPHGMGSIEAMEAAMWQEPLLETRPSSLHTPLPLAMPLRVPLPLLGSVARNQQSGLSPDQPHWLGHGCAANAHPLPTVPAWTVPRELVDWLLEEPSVNMRPQC